MKVGYVKTIKKQTVEAQSKILKSVGCTKIYLEEKLDTAVSSVSSGDILVVTRIIVYCRSVQELLDLVKLLKSKQVQFLCVEQNLSQPLKLIALLKILSEFESDLKEQRQAEGVAKAINNGVKFGRKRKLNDKKVSKAISLKALGYTNSEVANRFDVGVSTLFRYLAENKKAG